MGRQLRFYNRIILVLLIGLSAGCSGVSYVLQAAHGQFALVNRAKPLDEVIESEKTPPRIREVLKQVPLIKSFGERFGLKPTSNYTEYVDLNGPFVVWVVSACRPLQFESKMWNFPVVGSFSYLGWFKRDDAEGEAQELKKDGWDVDVRGATAYSTLGWFKDPILSSMIRSDRDAIGYLTNVVIHESVHATLYMNGQSYFNESLASYIADYLTPMYLAEKYGANSKELITYQKSEVFGKEREQHFKAAYQELEKLYKSQQSNDAKLTRKAQILADLQKVTEVKREINNATLIQYRTYGVGDDGFQELFRNCKEDIPRFLKRLAELETKDFPKEHDDHFQEVLNKKFNNRCE